MTELTVQTVDTLVALDRVARRRGPALRAYATALLVEAGEPTVDATELVIEALGRVLERRGFDRALAQRAVYDTVATVLLAVNDPAPA